MVGDLEVTGDGSGSGAIDMWLARRLSVQTSLDRVLPAWLHVQAKDQKTPPTPGTPGGWASLKEFISIFGGADGHRLSLM